MRATALIVATLLAVAAAACGCTDAGSTEPAAGAPTAETSTPAVEGAAAPVKVDGTVYGDGISLAETTQVSAIWADPAAFDGKRVRVEGLVTDVCPKRGCWLNVQSDEEFQTLKFKVVDGVMVFPMDARGKYAVAEGVISASELSLEETREMLAHEAEEKGEEFDPESVTAPMTMVRLDGVGAVIREVQ